MWRWGTGWGPSACWIPRASARPTAARTGSHRTALRPRSPAKTRWRRSMPRPSSGASSAAIPRTRWKTTPTAPPGTCCGIIPSDWNVCAAPQRYIGLDARKERAGALEARLAGQAEQAAEAARTEKSLKTAYDRYRDVLRSRALEQLAELWDSRAALEEAQADCAAQEQKLADCRENPMLQQLYREEEAREAEWEAARKAVEQAGGDIRVCEKQIASCEAEQKKGRGHRPAEPGGGRCLLRSAPPAGTAGAGAPEEPDGKRTHRPRRRPGRRKGAGPAGRSPAGLPHRYAGTGPEGLQRAVCLRLSAGSCRGGTVPRPARKPCPHRSGTVRRPAGTGPAGLQGPVPEGYPVPDEGRYLQCPPPVPGAEQGDGTADLRRGGLPL